MVNAKTGPGKVGLEGGEWPADPGRVIAAPREGPVSAILCNARFKHDAETLLRGELPGDPRGDGRTFCIFEGECGAITGGPESVIWKRGAACIG